MQKCEHRVIFTEKLEDPRINGIMVRTWSVDSACPACKERLQEEEIKQALSRMYAPEISELIFVAYEHKRDYFEAISGLSAKGIFSSLDHELLGDESL